MRLGDLTCVFHHLTCILGDLTCTLGDLTCIVLTLCREYRDARKIPLNVEHRMMLGMAPDYDHLMVIQKVEVFEHALDSTSGW